MTAVLTIELPIKTVSESNMREHHMAKARRVKMQRMTAFLLTHKACNEKHLGVMWWMAKYKSLTITLTRIAGKFLNPHDNLPRSFKAIVDGIADGLGTNDEDEGLTWKYAQELATEFKTVPQVYKRKDRVFTRWVREPVCKVRVEIREREQAASTAGKEGDA